MITIEPVPAGETLRSAFACHPSGVTAVCALGADDRPTGIAASSFVPVSLAPPLVSVCIQHASTTWPKLRRRPRLGLSVLSEGQAEVCMSLSRKQGDRFACISWAETAEGSVFVDGSSLWLDCTLHAEVPAGDHLIALLEIQGLRAEPGMSPLVFHGSRFRRLAA